MSPERQSAILVIFAITYLGIAMGHVPGLKISRVGIALLGAIAMMIFGGLGTAKVISYVNWPTILLLFGLFVISAQLRLSGFYAKVADGVAKCLSNPAVFLLVLMVVTGGLSAFLNHDVVCYVFTPIIGNTLLQKRINPVPFLIALAVASNIGAAATPIGNAQDLMISEAAHLGFGQYIAWCFAPVAFAMAAAYVIIWWMSRRRLSSNLEGRMEADVSACSFNRPHTIKGLIILILVIGLFFSGLPKEVVALTAAGIHLASTRYRSDDLLGLVDWQILVLFMALFVVAGAFQSTGYSHLAVQWLSPGGFDLNAPRNLALATAGLSNLVNNSAAVMWLLKVIDISRPVNAYVLALANSFGGSLFVIGSVSNLIVVQQASEMNIRITFWDFARLGIPVTFAALAGLLGWVAIMT